MNMNDKIINNLFEFWKHIGSLGQFLYETKGYNYVFPNSDSWPSKVFNISYSEVEVKELYQRIAKDTLPNSISFLENEVLEEQFHKHQFKLRSNLRCMYLNLHENSKPVNNFTSIEKVDTALKAQIFGEVASKSFGYTVETSTILPFIESNKSKLFIGKYRNEYASCGLVFLDEKGISGLHMIGTKPEFRGLGLGKTMTNKLLFESYENKSNQIVLVASESGERIYLKLGFIKKGNLRTYSITK